MPEPRIIRKIVVHCTDSEYGNRALVDTWHRQRKDSKGRPWQGIGYHFVVGNGRVDPMLRYRAEHDGLVEEGRSVAEKGAHVEGHNADTIGVALVGKRGLYTVRQVLALLNLVRRLLTEHALLPSDVCGHRDFEGVAKSCPDFDAADLRATLTALGPHNGHKTDA